MSDTVVLKGQYVTGANTAHRMWTRNPRREDLIRAFGFPLLGTFNVLVPTKDVRWIADLRPAARVKSWHKGKPGVTRYWPVCLSAKHGRWPAWCFQWKELPDTPDVTLELLTRERVPDAFKEGTVRVEVFGKWSAERVQAWVQEHPKMFQSFPWSGQRADSQLLWDLIGPRVEWKGRRVLDIGCHTGFHSFAALRAGALVQSVEISPVIREMARDVAHHIEGQPLRLLDRDPGSVWDTILYLSVHHQHDPAYKTLSQTLRALKARCRDLFVELIAPSRKGKVSADAVNALVGVAHFYRYTHRIRGQRQVYHLTGEDK